MTFMYQQGGKIGHSTSFSRHLLPRVHGVLGATFSGRRVGGTIQSGVKLNISIWFSEIVTRSVRFWHKFWRTSALKPRFSRCSQVSGMFSNRPYLPINFQVFWRYFIPARPAFRIFQDVIWHWKCFLLTQEAASHGRDANHNRATCPSLIWKPACQVGLDKSPSGNPNTIHLWSSILYIYIYTYVYSYNILLYIDIYIYICCEYHKFTRYKKPEKNPWASRQPMASQFKPESWSSKTMPRVDVENLSLGPR